MDRLSLQNLQHQPQQELRELLKMYKRVLRATHTEMADGLGMSRPKLVKFMNNDSEKLTVEPAQLVQLHVALSKPKTEIKRRADFDIQDDPKTIITEANKARAALKQRGPDELLEAAGFLPQQDKVLRISRERFAQVAQVVTMLDSELLPYEEMVSLVQELLTIISSRLRLESFPVIALANQKNEPLIVRDHELAKELELIRQYLQAHKVSSLPFINTVEEKLLHAGEGLKREGKTLFSQPEAIGLYRSIVTKELMRKEEPPLDIKVVKIEFQTISLAFSPKAEYEKVYALLRKLGDEAEEILKTRIDIPVTKASITCSFGLTPSQENVEKSKSVSKRLNWGYTSCSTLLTNAISACALQIGYCEEIAQILVTCKALGRTVDSLVESTVVLGERYQGIWVDRDLVNSVLQALVNAGKYWLGSQALYNQEFDFKHYVDLCEKLSELREKLGLVRSAFHEFHFFDEPFNLETCISIAKDAKEALNHIPQKKGVYFRHALELHRFYLMAKRLQLRLENIRGNVHESEHLIQDIRKEFDNIEDEDILRELRPSQALFDAEILLNSLSCAKSVFTDLKTSKLYVEGNSNSDPNTLYKSLLTDSEARKCWLKQEHKYIVDALDPKVLYQDPGVDTYLALSEIHGNIARIDFYFEEDRKVLELASDNFLKASHYASRIGSYQRTSRWLVLAGRTQTRLGDRELSGQLLGLAENLANVEYSSEQAEASPHQKIMFQNSLLSAVQLLKGERLLLLDENAGGALPYFLNALKGSIYLAFARRMSDALYNIARCSEHLASLSFKATLDEYFEGLISFEEKKSSAFTLSKNTISEAILKELVKIRGRTGTPSWLDVKDEFYDAAAMIWQSWQKTISPRKKHPIVQSIKNRTFLQKCRPSGQSM